MSEPISSAAIPLAIARSPLAGVEASSTVAATGGRRGVHIAELPAMAAQLVIARRGRAADVMLIAKDALGLELPATPRHVAHPDGKIEALWSGPSQWLLLAPATTEGDLAERVARVFGQRAASINQSNAHSMLAITGPNVLGTLEKLVAIDVADAAFPVGAAAMTAIAHIPVHLWRVNNLEGCASFRMAAPQSYARSLWHHVTIAAAEYGLDAVPLSNSSHV